MTYILKELKLIFNVYLTKNHTIIVLIASFLSVLLKL